MTNLLAGERCGCRGNDRLGSGRRGRGCEILRNGPNGLRRGGFRGGSFFLAFLELTEVGEEGLGAGKREEVGGHL